MLLSFTENARAVFFLESHIVGGRAIEPPTLFRDVELCLNVPKKPPLALNYIIREDMQELLYVRV